MTRHNHPQERALRAQSAFRKAQVALRDQRIRSAHRRDPELSYAEIGRRFKADSETVARVLRT